MHTSAKFKGRAQKCITAWNESSFTADIENNYGIILEHIFSVKTVNQACELIFAA